MSYSYIKSVFPNFENLNKVYDESLYSNLQQASAQLPTQLPTQVPVQAPTQVTQVPVQVPTQVTQVPTQVTQVTQVPTQVTQVTQVPTQPPAYNGLGDFASSLFEKNPIQNNLKYYNKSVDYNKSVTDQELIKTPVELYKYQQIAGNSYDPYNYNYNYTKEFKPQDLTEKNKIEKFEMDNYEDNCDIYIKHILQCSKCREVVTRQFGIDSDRINNEEIMEVVSYLIFGLFILLLINSIKNKE
jgi:hypothetical protein